MTKGTNSVCLDAKGTTEGRLRNKFGESKRWRYKDLKTVSRVIHSRKKGRSERRLAINPPGGTIEKEKGSKVLAGTITGR